MCIRDSSKTLIFSFDADISLRPEADLLHIRFLEADILHVRPGKSKEFHELAKMWVDLGQKAGPAVHLSLIHISLHRYAQEDRGTQTPILTHAVFPVPPLNDR